MKNLILSAFLVLIGTTVSAAVDAGTVDFSKSNGQLKRQLHCSGVTPRLGSRNINNYNDEFRRLRFTATVVTHLKSKFPELKIGGPAFAWFGGQVESFLKEMATRAALLVSDFRGTAAEIAVTVKGLTLPKTFEVRRIDAENKYKIEALTLTGETLTLAKPAADKAASAVWLLVEK